jgi:undecaprenyl-diphosphatase
MLGAFTYDLLKNRALLSLDDGLIIALGFIAAFCAALVVVRWVLDYVARNGFAVFAIWRIFIGSLGLIGLWVLG